jgi:hypothetical protein
MMLLRLLLRGKAWACLMSLSTGRAFRDIEIDNLPTDRTFSIPAIKTPVRTPKPQSTPFVVMLSLSKSSKYAIRRLESLYGLLGAQIPERSRQMRHWF